ncbi:MAG TPA: DUF302 domain-containing protein [Methanomassiliicoccales archaeon]|jgi:uncharacterized protein (DUF302 family)
MLSESSGSASKHDVERLSFEIGHDYNEFCQRFERAVPMFDPNRSGNLVRRRATWEEVVADAQASAPHGFFIYWKLDTSPIMGLAGHSDKCTIYLMGNHTIAERMFRFDPSVMLYVPLRLVICSDHGQKNRLVMDRPSSVLSSLDRPEITKVGIELDDKLMKLLRHLQVNTD